MLAALPGVAEVGGGNEWIAGYAQAVGLIRGLGLAIGIVLGLATLLIVANTIRLSIYARRDELDILRLVGASPSYVSAPFLLEGLVEGLCGGLLGLVALFAAFHGLAPLLRGGLALLIGDTTPEFLSSEGASWLVAAGAGLGVDSYHFLDRLTTRAMKGWAEREPVRAIPCTPLSKPLCECRVALVSSAAIALKSDIPFDLELERLYAYTAALGKIEKRKLDLMAKVNEAGKKKSVAEQELGRLRQKIEAQMDLQKKTQDGLARLKSPPKLDSVQSYFSAPDLSAQIKGMFEQASDALIEMLGGFRKEMVHLLRTDKPVTSKVKGRASRDGPASHSVLVVPDLGHQSSCATARVPSKPFTLSQSKGELLEGSTWEPFMVRQAHHERRRWNVRHERRLWAT